MLPIYVGDAFPLCTPQERGLDTNLLSRGESLRKLARRYDLVAAQVDQGGGHRCVSEVVAHGGKSKT